MSSVSSSSDSDERWLTNSLGNLFDITTGKLDANAAEADGEYPFFTCSDEISYINSHAFDCQAVLLAGNGGFHVKKYEGKFNAYQRTYVLQPKELDLDYAFLLVQFLIGKITAPSRGSTIQYLRIGDITSVEAVYPRCKKVQKSIAGKINHNLSVLEEGISSLKIAERQLELYRQSVLKDGFEGKLTADWRKANPDLVEPADKLLARIEAERKAAHQAELDAWEDAVNQWETNGKNGKKPTKPKLVKSYQDSDIKGNPQSQLPPSWTICLLGSLMVKPPKNGIYKPQSEYKDDGIPIVRIDNLKPSKIDHLDKLKKVELDSNELLQYKLTDGDLVLNRVNSIEHIGKSAFINQPHLDLVFESNLMTFHPSEYFIDRKYLITYLNSPNGLKELRKNAKHAVNQASINQGDVANAIVILPSYAEQMEIGRIFEKFEFLNAQFKKQIMENIHRAKVLKQSILKQAFSGHELLEDAS